jgi:hypothetical protein
MQAVYAVIELQAPQQRRFAAPRLAQQDQRAMFAGLWFLMAFACSVESAMLLAGSPTASRNDCIASGIELASLRMLS